MKESRKCKKEMELIGLWGRESFVCRKETEI